MSSRAEQLPSLKLRICLQFHIAVFQACLSKLYNICEEDRKRTKLQEAETINKHTILFFN